MLYNRETILTFVTDKYRVREYVVKKVGCDFLIPLIWNGEKPDEIPFDQLPQSFVIKTNHGCDQNIIVADKTKIDPIMVKRKLKKWMNENFGNDTGPGIVWGYKNIKPHIIIESFIGERGKAPLDFKFFCFSGRMEYFKIDFDRFEGHSEKFFDRSLRGLDLFEVGLKMYKGNVSIPANFREMISVAESLSEGFDFIRVDLYNVNNKIYFGELTPYPGGISAKFEPDSYDYIFGEKWKQ